MTIGAFVSLQVKQCRLPTEDSVGTPVTYQLRLASDGHPLPAARRFAELRVGWGTCFVLEPAVLNFATLPLARPATPQGAPPSGSRWNRRSVLVVGGLLTTCAVAGLETGMATALAKAYLSRRTAVSVPAVPGPPLVPTSIPPIAQRQVTFSGHQQRVRVVAWSPDGTMLASGGDDAQVLIWGTNGVVYQRIPHQTAVQALAWSPEGQRLVTGAAQHVTFLRVLTGTVLARSTHQHTANVSSVAWTPYGQMQVVSGAHDRRALVWETTSYQAQTIFAHHTTAIEGVCWAADGHTIASSSLGGVVRVWNAALGQEVHGFYQDAQVPMRVLAFAPLGMQLAVGGDDGMLRLWNGLLCQQQAPDGPEGMVCRDTPQRFSSSSLPLRALAWSPDGRYLASGSDDGRCIIWHPSQHQQPPFTILVEPQVPVQSLAWSPDGTLLAIVTGKTITVWKLSLR